MRASPFALLLGAFALVVALYAALAPRVATPSGRAPAEARAPEDAAPEDAAPEASGEGDLLGSMARFQRYFEKAAAAGQAENWQLAAFYAHELEETAGHVAASAWAPNGVALGPLAAEWAVPAAARLHEAAEAADDVAYGEALEGVASACGACHRATGHAFLRIAVPSDAAAAFPSQLFAPEAAGD